MITAAKIALVLAGSLVVGAGIGAGVGAVVNAVRPAAQDDIRQTDALGGGPAGAPPTGEPTVVNDPADIDSWIIDFGSVGPLRVGDSFSQIPDRLPGFDDGTDYSLEYCPVLVGTFTRQGLGFVIPEWQGAIDLIDMYGTAGVGPRTANGIGFGATMDDLQGAYPSGVIEGQGYDGEPYFGVSNGSSRIVFSVSPDRGVDRVILTSYEGIPEEYCA